MTLRDIIKIDYAAISALTSISDDLKSKEIVINGDFPLSIDCRQFLIESGFLNKMVDENNKKFPANHKSDFIVFEKGEGILSKKDRKAISSLMKDVVRHLLGDTTDLNLKPVISAILEICGNSIEHAEKDWLLGIKYGEDKVTFTVNDVGKGILETLHFKFSKHFWEYMGIKSSLDMLSGAFEKKYGSSTEEINRNKGLPSIKANFDNGIIKNLIVLTNNVILHFANKEGSRVLNKGRARFKGTFYQWQITKSSIINAITVKNGSN